MSEVQLGTLTLGDEIAAGGQGSVTALKSDPSTVLKRYHDASGPDFNAETLRWLVAERSRIFLAGSPVEEWSAWPKAVVRDGGRVVGFLMPRVPEAFTIEIGGRSRLADLSYLAAEPSPLWADVPLPTDEERVRVLHHLAAAMQALHHRDIVMGDVSFANIIWARTPRPRVMLIDCDGMRPPSRQPVLPQAETPDWDDPTATPGSQPDHSRDCYKLALAVLRVLTRDLQARPAPGGTPPLRGIDEHAAGRLGDLIARAAGPRNTCPPASEWAAALSARATVPAAPLAPRTIQAPAPKPALLDSEQRSYRPVRPPES